MFQELNSQIENTSAFKEKNAEKKKSPQIESNGSPPKPKFSPPFPLEAIPSMIPKFRYQPIPKIDREG